MIFMNSNNKYGYLGESQTCIAIICPKCKKPYVVNKNEVNRKDKDNAISMEHELICKCKFHSVFINNQYIRNAEIFSFNILIICSVLTIISIVIEAVLLSSIDKYPTELQSKFGLSFLYLTIALIVLTIILFITFAGENARKKNMYMEVLSKELENDKIERFETLRNIITEKISNANVPQSCATITLKNGYIDLNNGNLQKGTYYIWKNDNTLCMFPFIKQDSSLESLAFNKDLIRKFTLATSNIEYYTTQGEIYRENKISGGGGGGTSVAGAVVGGVIAGGAGAIIGSRQKTNDIKSELITHDTRETLLNFFDASNKKRSIFFELKDYQTLMNVIPEKEYNLVSTIKTNQTIKTIQQSDNSKLITEQIKELAKLRDNGIISEEEFTGKKKELLAKI